uniref:Retrotransposon gag domain-containing protein n=1 Tax=Fagus sylvatica TaxID=28930 RepID=A0A2N9GTM4_FAGSY
MAILPDFRGLENENPYVHVRAFEEVIGSFYAQNVIETAKLRFFPFSLKDKAKGWLYTLKPRSIGSWGEMTQEFYKKFFPPHKLRIPTHRNGPSPLDSTNRNRSSTTTSGGNVFRLKEEDNINAKISLLTKEIEALKLKGSRGVNAVYREDPMEACRICQEIDHTTSACKIDEEMRETKSQVARLTEALSRTERGKLPSQTQPNPNNQSAKVINTDKFEEVKSITILRSGKEIEKDAPKANEKSKETPAKNDESGIAKSNDIEKCPFPTPFPQALKLPKNLDVTSEILEHLHQVKVNLPLLHLIKQMPLYAKVIKDLCTVKRKHHVKKTAFLTEQVSAIIQHKVPPKYKDPGCPTISCTIGDYNIKRTLLDLGVSVNLLPFSVYLQLGLGELKPTFVTLQLADRSVRKPRGVVEDVLVKVENFYYPVDFIILDIEPTLHPSANIPIILGRHFLATANALINCRNGRMKITFGSMTAELNIFNVNPQQLVDEECEYVNFIEAAPQEEFNKNCFSDPFETLLVDSIVSNELKPTAKLFDSSLLDSLQILEEEQVIEAKNPPRSKKKSLLAYSDAPKLRLKKTPKGLPLASIEPHATSAVEVPSKESVDQEVEKAGEKTKFFEKYKTKRKVLQDTRLSKKLLNSSKGVALHVAKMKSARGSNYSFGGSRSGG